MALPLLDLGIVSKPIIEVGVRSREGGRARVLAVFDTGSHVSIIREAKLPSGARVTRYAKAERLLTAAHGGQLRVTGEAILYIEIGRKLIRAAVSVSPDLRRDMLIGAGAMQEWDISIHNGHGKTTVAVGRDLRDPELTEVDAL